MSTADNTQWSNTAMGNSSAKRKEPVDGYMPPDDSDYSDEDGVVLTRTERKYKRQKKEEEKKFQEIVQEPSYVDLVKVGFKNYNELHRRRKYHKDQQNYHQKQAEFHGEQRERLSGLIDIEPFAFRWFSETSTIKNAIKSFTSGESLAKAYGRVPTETEAKELVIWMQKAMVKENLMDILNCLGYM